MKMKITFVRVERVCDHNKVARREESAKAQPNPHQRLNLIYDYDVMIDGVKRGTFWRNFCRTGYRLNNLAGDPWLHQYTERQKDVLGQRVSEGSPRTTKARSTFLGHACTALKEGHLITPSEAAGVLRIKDRKKHKAQLESYKEACEAAMNSNGAKLYATLVEIQATIQRMPAGNRGDPTLMSILRFAQKAIDEVKMPSEKEFVK